MIKFYKNNPTQTPLNNHVLIPSNFEVGEHLVTGGQNADALVIGQQYLLPFPEYSEKTEVFVQLNNGEVVVWNT